MPDAFQRRAPRQPVRWVRRAIKIAIVALLLGFLPPAAPAHAAVFNVNSLADPDPATGACPATCTLRNAITQAAAGDTIQFSVTGTILLNASLTLSKNVAIQGPGAASLILDGQDAHGVFKVSSDVQASLSGLTIQRGYNEIGAGGVSNTSGSVSLLNVVVRDNRGVYGGGVSALGFTTPSTVTVTNSTITNNRADVNTSDIFPTGNGGGIGSFNGTVVVSGSTISNNAARSSDGEGGGISVVQGSAQIDRSTISGNTASSGAGLYALVSTVTVVNSTISNNTASFRAGGLDVRPSATAALRHVTMSGNSAPTGGAFYGDTAITLRNSIVVSSPSGGNCSSPVTSAGNNLSDTTACFAGGSQGDIVTATPLLGPLASNSPGVTQTHALLFGSPAIDGVTYDPTDCPATVVTDQRGVARPQTWAAARCDIGAFELEANTPPTISNPGGQTFDEDGPTPLIFVTIGDAETPGNLTVTGSSSNQALLPNTGVAVSTGGLLRAITLSPLANQSGNATVTLTVSDGYATATAAFGVTVNPVNDPPQAANDAYGLDATKLLTVPAAGVLANDADIDGPGLAAVLQQGPSHGTLDLRSDGSFTYQPTGTYTGQDTFTYRASDGSATSNVATVTIKVKPLACTPRPQVRSQLATGGGKLLVTVSSSPVADQEPAVLRELRFGQLQNAKVIVNGQTMANGQTFVVPGNASTLGFTVDRIVDGQPTTVPLTVVDDCGAWPTFVGGGAGAGF